MCHGVQLAPQPVCLRLEEQRVSIAGLEQRLCANHLVDGWVVMVMVMVMVVT